MTDSKSAAISIIMPVLNEVSILPDALMHLQQYRQKGHELIVVDGGSRDGSMRIATDLADRVIISGAGRAMQMNAGVEYASHQVLLFLHADPRLPEDADTCVQAALEHERYQWGRFDLKLSGSHGLYRLLEWSINWRSALSGVATGDQAIFVRRQAFERVGAYADLPLMEDVALSKKLRRMVWPRRIRRPVSSSSRKWEREGPLRVILLMWFLRTAYFFGVHPSHLVRFYYREQR